VQQALAARDVEDWAAMSRPQIYYSLKKLRRLRLVAPHAADAEAARGPERTVVALTAAGRAALRRGLAGPRWAEQRPPPPFLTWLALAPQATSAARAATVARRRRFVAAELERERATLAAIEAEIAMAQLAAPPAPPMLAPARLMDALTVSQLAAELAWLDEVERALP
jgi:DNA-binding PadR family transcriptional regulator